MSGNQNIDLTGELLLKVESLISGKVTNIQQSISGSKDSVVMQVKSELGSEYQKIVEGINGGIANQMSIFNGSIAILSAGIALISTGIVLYIKSILKDIGKINETKMDVEKFISEQEQEIYKKVMQRNVENYYNRIKNQPRDLESNLFGILASLDQSFLNNRHFNILKTIYNNEIEWSQVKLNARVLIFQYFPQNILLDKKLFMIDLLYLSTIIQFCVYDEELLLGTEKIINSFPKESGPQYIDFLKNYFGSIYKFNKHKSMLIDNVQNMLNNGFEEYKIDMYDCSGCLWRW